PESPGRPGRIRRGATVLVAAAGSPSGGGPSRSRPSHTVAISLPPVARTAALHSSARVKLPGPRSANRGRAPAPLSVPAGESGACPTARPTSAETRTNDPPPGGGGL